MYMTYLCKAPSRLSRVMPLFEILIHVYSFSDSCNYVLVCQECRTILKEKSWLFVLQAWTTYDT